NNSDKIDIVYPGDRVNLVFLEENLSATLPGDEYWAKVKFHTKEGFIPFKFLQTKVPKKISKIRRRGVVIPKPYFVSVKNLPVRLEPDLQSIPIFSISQNAEVIVNKFSDNDEVIDGIVGKWAFIVYGRSEGWVFSGFLGEDKNQDSENIPDRITVGKIFYVNTSEVSVRDEPSNFGTPISVLNIGEAVEVIDKKRFVEVNNGIKSSWVKVSIDNLEGWVYGGFLSPQKPEKPKIVLHNNKFLYPLEYEKSKMTSNFGPRIDPVTGRIGANHTGVDLYPFSRFGAPIFSAGDGSVVHQSKNSGYGNLTVVQHSNGLVTYYAHQQKFMVKENDKVKAGDLIGEVGSSGKSTGPHLHFEVRTGLWQEQLNPEKFINVPKN
ncbi:MAG: M23 family metallopeptidase, partial [Spirochaetia bacterium]|nr:M23 family metallopeptidase [Spirochaetia bacterium]